MGVLKEIFIITDALNKLLITEKQTKHREQMIEKINELLEKREFLLQQIKHMEGFGEEEKWLGNQIINLNKEVEQKLNTLFKEIKSGIHSIQKQKKLSQNYLNPYENVQLADGMFLDSKQ